MYEKKAIRQ